MLHDAICFCPLPVAQQREREGAREGERQREREREKKKVQVFACRPASCLRCRLPIHLAIKVKTCGVDTSNEVAGEDEGFYGFRFKLAKITQCYSLKLLAF